MAHQVPTTIMPSSLVVGDLWTWRAPAQPNYPAASWTLSFAFMGLESFQVAGGSVITAEGTGSWLVAVPKTTTATLKPGRYQWRAYVTSGSERYQVGAGTVVVEPNAAAATGDRRSHAQKMLSLCEAALEGRILTQEESYAIGARSMSKTPIPELQRLRGTWAAEVWREMNPGKAMGSVGVEFRRASS